ncbi:MAG: metal ABC transporter ATP-binding protein [Nitrososphaerota archaeon]|nr:metal ABC transporter ATP-binding protein [Candidatus Calditenuaceae archaeon]MDW8073413.1 metal ABC transporter ATP-binding protein [Nitrososphaerota archaeon]
MNAVELDSVTLRYDDVVAVSDVSFSVEVGRMVALIGPNGAGKTSLLKMLAGLLKPTSGRIWVLGREPWRARGLVAYTPQREEVYWDYPLTVRELVAMGTVRRRGLLRWLDARDGRVEAALRLVMLEDLSSRRISELSGGQQQRAFLARAICQGGEVYLLDEPIAGLDAPSEAVILEILKKLRDQGKTILMATHDISATLEIFDYVALVRNGLVAFGPPSDVLTSENLTKTYGGAAVALHLDDIERVAGWR